MKKSFIILTAAFAMASAAFAQTEKSDKDAVWAAKAAEKAKKVQDAADLKAFKEKQKADLAAFIDAQKNGKKASEVSMEMPALTSDADSAAYKFGIAMSNGLKGHATTNLGVAEENFGEFSQGIVDRAKLDPNDKVKAAYNAGFSIGGQVVAQAERVSKQYFEASPDSSLNQDIIVAALLQGFNEKSAITPEAAGKEFDGIMKARTDYNKEKLYAANRIAGEKFLEENKTKAGVVTLPSGLQYKIITEGKGAIPTASDRVEVDYEGTLIDGTVFDSSYKRATSATFGVTQVIKGWTEALQLMPVGSKWELYIPYQLAYGERETGKEIKPYSALIFTVELKGIKDKDKEEPRLMTGGK